MPTEITQSTKPEKTDLKDFNVESLRGIFSGDWRLNGDRYQLLSEEGLLEFAVLKDKPSLGDVNNCVVLSLNAMILLELSDVGAVEIDHESKEARFIPREAADQNEPTVYRVFDDGFWHSVESKEPKARIRSQVRIPRPS